MKKVGKTTRNQISYDYTVEMRNRFKGLDATDRVPEELWTQVHDTVQEASPRKRNAKRQNGCLRRPYKLLRKNRSKQQGEIRNPSSVISAKK